MYDFDKFREKTDSLAALPNSFGRGFSAEIIDTKVLSTAAATKAAITNSFDDAPLIMSMMGHGASDRYGEDSNGDSTFLNTDANALTNSKYPIVMTWNCETAFHFDDDNTSTTLGEDLIFNANGGAIAFLGSTTQTTPSAQLTLARSTFQLLAERTNTPGVTMRLGDLFTQAKLTVGSGSYEKDVINSFSLFGDPALSLPSSIFTPPAPVATASEEAPSSGGGGGCSVFGAGGNMTIPWYIGLIEMLFYFLTILGIGRIKNQGKSDE